MISGNKVILFPSHSNQLEFTSVEDGGKKTSEKTPLIDQITSRQRKSPDSPAVPVRYPDINANEKALGSKATGKSTFPLSLLKSFHFD